MRESALAHLETLVCRHPSLAGQREAIARAVELIAHSFRTGGKLLVCGNGGSAADAEHIVGELMKGFRLRRPLPEEHAARLRTADAAEGEHLARRLQRGLPAVALTGHPSLSTAVLNDLDPHLGFAQQVHVLGREGDVLLGISTSGNARNVTQALLVGKVFGLCTIGLCGDNPCRMDGICDCVIHVPETEVYKAQELHLPVYHGLCSALEEEFFGPEA